MTPSHLAHRRARLAARGRPFALAARGRPLALLALVAGLAVPAAAPGQTPAPPDGSVAAPPQTPAPPDGSSAAPPQPTTVAAGNGRVAIATRVDAFLRRTTRFRGTVTGARPGRTITVERFDPVLGGWAPIATAQAGAEGSYLARWRTDRLGVLRIRAVVGAAAHASAASASPEVSVTVYRDALATWYGPGLYGRRTACGVQLSPALLGVAHRTLPCGTPVELSYRGHRIVVPVVDRGPYAHGASYDLTAAAAQALGFAVTDRIGVLRVGDPPPAAG